MTTNELFKAAIAVRLNAYSPYSKFKVGAALIDDKDRSFAGCNFENSSYGATICAERNAIGAMVAAGGVRFKEIVIVTDTPHGCPPCGICRQVLAEFAKNPKETKIHIATPQGVVKTLSLLELLPEAFDSTFFTEKN